MSIFFLSLDQAMTHEELRPLLEVQSNSIEDYVPAFQALTLSNFLQKLVTESLRDLAGVRARLEACSTEREWRLLLSDHFSLVVRKLPNYSLLDSDFSQYQAAGAKRVLAALPNDILLGVVGEGQVTTHIYRSAFARDVEVFSRDHRLELVEQRQLRGGDYLALHASEEVADFVKIDGEVAFMELALLGAKRIVWNYDAETLKAAYSSSASVDATRMEFAIELFRLFEAENSAPTLRRIAKEHSHHWVRWKAITTLLTLNLDEGVDALRESENDAHIHVRRAAAKTLDNFRQAKVIA